ncbi:MAG: RNA methyltransferase substrate-binding domain-containing protein [Saprospiraceae bacterium]
MNKISINDAKLIRSLTIKKYRQEYKKFIIEGEKLVLEAIKYRNDKIDKLYCSNNFFEKHKSDVFFDNLNYQIVENKELSKVSNFKSSDSQF